MELIDWFRDPVFYRKLPISTKDNTTTLTDLLWNNKSKVKAIFGKTSIKRYNVECLMESVIAAKIISWNVKKDDIELDLNRVMVKADAENDALKNTQKNCYEIDVHWKGIHLK